MKLLSRILCALLLVFSGHAYAYQATIAQPTTGPHTMADLNTNFLNPALLTLETNSKGPIAPSNPQLGMLWVNDGVSPWILETYDGTWLPIASIDPSAHAFTLYPATLPVPGSSTLGGVKASSAPANQFQVGIDVTGAPIYAQPTASNISGLGALATITPGTGVVTALTTPNSANFRSAIPDETGSGSMVFGTSPSIASPSLSGTATSNGNIYINSSTGGWLGVSHFGGAGANALYGFTNGSQRWATYFGDGSAESGGNAGSDYYLIPSNDSGVNIGTALKITRATMNSQFGANLAIPASAYFNFGGTIGSGGYGFFDNAGAPQAKAAGGAWSDILTASNTETLLNKVIDTASSNTVKINGNTLAAAAGTATITMPNSSDTLVGRATSDTLSNKTLDTASGNVIKLNGNTLAASAAGTATITVPNATDTLVNLASAQTLTNKTLTSPVMTTPNLGTPSAAVLTNATGLPTTGLTGVLQAAQEPAHTGDVTNTAGSLAYTITAGAVSTTKMANLAANTVLANPTAAAAAPSAMALPSCSTSASALLYTTSTGLSCNTAINAATLGGATFAAPGSIGATTAAPIKLTTLTGTNLIGSNVAPTVTGFCTSPSVTANNGTWAFAINVGTACAASTGTITLPAATNGWVCNVFDVTTPASNFPRQTGGTTTTATLTNYNASNVATNWTSSDVIRGSCLAY